LPPRDGYLFLDRTKFAASFAADVDPSIAEFMANSQVSWGVDALGGQITEPAGCSFVAFHREVFMAAAKIPEQRAVRRSRPRAEKRRIVELALRYWRTLYDKREAP
jgi:hypothetical protein